MKLRDFIAFASKRHGTTRFKSGRWITAGKNVEFSVKYEVHDDTLAPMLRVYLYGHLIAVVTAGAGYTTVALSLAGYDTPTTHRWHDRIISALRRDGVHITWHEQNWRMPTKLAVSGIGARRHVSMSIELGHAVGFTFSTVTFCGTRFPFSDTAWYSMSVGTPPDGHAEPRMTGPSSHSYARQYYVKHRPEWSRARQRVGKYRRSLMSTAGLTTLSEFYALLPNAHKFVPQGQALRDLYAGIYAGTIPIHDGLLRLGVCIGELPSASESILRAEANLCDMTCPSKWADDVLSAAQQLKRKRKSPEETQQ